MSLQSKLRKAYRVWRSQGTRAFLSKSLHILRQRIDSPEQSGAKLHGAAQLLLQAKVQPHPLRAYPAPTLVRRINLVADSINGTSAASGTATALIFAALLAERSQATLRVITRTERTFAANLPALFRQHEIAWQGNIELLYAPFDGKQADVDVSAGDRFVTTSWWNTACVRATLAPERIVYLLQEDERLALPHGDQRLACERILSDAGLRFVVQSQLLFDHFVASGLEHLKTRGSWFEPALPGGSDVPKPPTAGTKRQFTFDARPNYGPALFHTGLQAIDSAVAQGILKSNDWDFHLVGNDIPQVTLCDGTQPQRHEDLSATAYRERIAQTDLGLSLVAGPQPGQVVFDLAAAGAVVVTNQFGQKQSLASLSPNILTAPLDVPALVAALETGAALARDTATRAANRAGQPLPSSWPAALANVWQATDSATTTATGDA